MKTRPNPVAVIVRGLVRRCPNCGAGGIFKSWFNLKSACPRCGLDFEREPGWWIGGMIVNIGASMFVLFAVAAAGMALYWPDFPVLALTLVCMATMAVFPIVFYPMSKTVWLGIDLIMTGMDPTTRK